MQGAQTEADIEASLSNPTPDNLDAIRILTNLIDRGVDGRYTAFSRLY
jgi:hypothetical protein